MAGQAGAQGTGTEILCDAQGIPLACYEPGNRGDRLWADDVCWIGAPDPATAAAAVLHGLPGWGATAAATIGDALIAAGAERQRLFHTYTRDLAQNPAPAEPALPAGLLALPAMDVEADTLHEALLAAYPPDHPDHDEDALENLAGLYDGSLMGPLLPCSTVAWDGQRAVAAVLVQDTGGTPPLEGPWISDAFRHPGPDHAGLGTLLLRTALSRATTAALPALGLSVTDTNPARTLYEQLRFTRTASWMDLILEPSSRPHNRGRPGGHDG